MFYHLKIIVRNLQRDKFHSAINIGGLSIGMAAAILLLVWVYNQWSHDRFHEKANLIHQVWTRATTNGQVNCWDVTSLVIGPALKDEYPEVVESVRVSNPNSYFFGEGDRQMKFQTLQTDPSFLTVFSFPLLQGDVNTALNDPYSVILTEKAALQLFGDEDPMGKTIMYDVKYPVTVTGIMKDLPDNTRFDFEILGSIQLTEKMKSAGWNRNSIYTYVELSPHAQLDRLNEAVCDIIKRHTDNEIPWEAFLYPLDKSYLYNWFENGVPSGGLITFLRILVVIAGIILIIACINFVNLSIARSSLRAKEVGVRKVLGSRRIGLIRLFLSESIILASISGAIALVLAYAVIPWFSEWLGVLNGKILSLDILNIRFWFFALGFILFTGLLAGSYPAFYLSAFRPVSVLKGVVSVAGPRVTLRKQLVVMQFSFAVLLIFGTLVMRMQIIHEQNRNPGYDRERLVHTPFPEGIKNHYQAFRNDLMVSGAITDITKAGFSLMKSRITISEVSWQGKDPEDRRAFNLYFADSNWAKMMGLEIVTGRYPDSEIWPTDSSAILINETAAKMIGFENPIGETVAVWGHEGHVTGVVKDFVVHSSLFEKAQPVVIGSEKIGYRERIYIRLTPGKVADRLATVEAVFKKYSPEYPFEYVFADDEYIAKFDGLQAVNSLTGFFSVVAILISCMGLFALVAFTAERRRKEIAIRKVMGASVTDLVLLLSKEYLKLTTIAFAIVTLPAWMVMQGYMNMFGYPNIPVWMIAAVGIFMLLITLITVCSQAIIAASANPAKAIKTE